MLIYVKKTHCDIELVWLWCHVDHQLADGGVYGDVQFIKIFVSIFDRLNTMSLNICFASTTWWLNVSASFPSQKMSCTITQSVEQTAAGI